MKYMVMVLCLVWASPCFAASCPDVQESVSAAIQGRSERVSASYDILIPDPELERGALSGCLGTINDIGGAFSLGVSLPSMEQIVAGLCNQVDSMIQQKINEAHNDVLNRVNSIGGGNIYKVYGTGGEYIIKIKDSIR